MVMEKVLQELLLLESIKNECEKELEAQRKNLEISEAAFTGMDKAYNQMFEIVGRDVMRRQKQVFKFTFKNKKYQFYIYDGRLRYMIC